MNHCILTAQVIDYRYLFYSQELNIIQVICCIPDKNNLTLLIFNSCAIGQTTELLNNLLMAKNTITFEGSIYMHHKSKLLDSITDSFSINLYSNLFIYLSKVYRA